MITAVVTSDNHLGTYYARMKPDRLEERRKRLQQAFERVVSEAIERQADLFLHAGDLYDRPDPRNADRRFVACQIRRLNDAGIPVFAIAGNHDSPRAYGYDGRVTPHEEMEALGAVTLFRDMDRLAEAHIHIRGGRVRVRGMSSDFNRPPDSCPLEGLDAGPRSAEVEIVLLHYGIQGISAFEGEPALSMENLDRLDADVICVGHLHRRTERRLPRGGLLLNPGATEHIHFGEEGLDTGFWILRLDAGRAEAEYVHIAAQPMRTLDLDVGALAESSDDLTAAIIHRIETVSAPDQLLRVRLAGILERTRINELDMSAIQVCGASLNFACQIESADLALFDRLGDLVIQAGFSFDPRAVIRDVAQAVAHEYDQDDAEREITRAAEQEVLAAYDHIIGGSR